MTAEIPVVTRAAREQANIAVELAPPGLTGDVVAVLAAAVYRLADVVDYLDEQLRLTIALRAVDAETVER